MYVPQNTFLSENIYYFTCTIIDYNYKGIILQLQCKAKLGCVCTFQNSKFCLVFTIISVFLISVLDCTCACKCVRDRPKTAVNNM